MSELLTRKEYELECERLLKEAQDKGMEFFKKQQKLIRDYERQRSKEYVANKLGKVSKPQ